MSDLTGLTALDVAIGLAFLFFLLSTVCASINEAVAGYLGWRAQELEKALEKLLGGDPKKVDALFEDPRIHPLVDHKRNERRSTRRRSPSYLPASTVARYLLKDFPDDAAQFEQAAQKIESPIVRQAVLDAIRDGRDTLEEMHEAAERAFDQVMDRCSGWYKRRAHKFLLIFAALVTLALNVDAFHVADTLAKDDALRASVVSAATTAEETAPDAQAVADQIDGIKQLGLPFGWSDHKLADVPEEIARSLPGYLLTILAIMLGAPFWFDLLGRFARLRNSGNREGTIKDPARTPDDRDARPPG